MDPPTAYDPVAAAVAAAIAAASGTAAPAPIIASPDTDHEVHDEVPATPHTDAWSPNKADGQVTGFFEGVVAAAAAVGSQGPRPPPSTYVRVHPFSGFSNSPALAQAPTSLIFKRAPTTAVSPVQYRHNRLPTRPRFPAVALAPSQGVAERSSAGVAIAGSGLARAVTMPAKCAEGGQPHRAGHRPHPSRRWTGAARRPHHGGHSRDRSPGSRVGSAGSGGKL